MPASVNGVASAVQVYRTGDAGAQSLWGNEIGHPEIRAISASFAGLPSQMMTLNRRLAGFHLNELQTQFLNGYPEWLAHPQGAVTAKLPLFNIDQHDTAKKRVLGTAKYRSTQEPTSKRRAPGPER